MATHDIVKGMKVAKGEDISFCEDCVEGNMSRQLHQSVKGIPAVGKLSVVIQLPL